MAITLEWAFGFLKENDPGFDGFKHIDHICSEGIAHDLTHCSLDESQVYTADDAAKDSRAAFIERLGL